MTEGVVARWCVSDGDAVNKGDDIYELEYDKATSIVNSRASGIVKLLYEEGATVPLGDAVAVILENGEAFDESMVSSGFSVANAGKGGVSEVGNSDGGVSYGASHKTAADNTENTGADGEKPRILVTPLVRKLAKDMGIDLSDVAKPGMRVTKQDLEAYQAQRASQPQLQPDSQPQPDPQPQPHDDAQEKHARKGRRIPLSGMRKAIAENMTKSYFSYPTVTLNTDADMTALLILREQWNQEHASENIKLSVTDMLVKAVAKALKEHEIVNTSLDGNEIVFHEEINIGIAVALEVGLVVPVVRNADKLGIEEIAKEIKRLAALAKSGRISGDEMRGGTFTVTNLGMLGIDIFNPIINPPQSAVLGVGRIVKKPMVSKNDEIIIQHRMTLSFTHDHRVIDGAPGAYFLQSVVRYLERPFLLLTD